MRVVKQITPLTCALACLESFLADQGVRVTQDELLRCHPDLCLVVDPSTGLLDPGQYHLFGAMNAPELVELCGRFCCDISTVSQPSVPHVERILQSAGEGVFALCRTFEGRAGDVHWIRLKEAAGVDVTYLNPAMFRPAIESVAFATLIDPQGWHAELLHIKAPQPRQRP